MSLNDPLSDALHKIYHYEMKNKKECLLKNCSNLLINTLEILKDHKYIGDFEIIETSKGRFVKVNLIGNINKCSSIKPRQPVEKDEIINYEKQYLPAIDFGIIIISTNQGLMTHKEAVKKNIGGRLIAYCY